MREEIKNKFRFKLSQKYLICEAAIICAVNPKKNYILLFSFFFFHIPKIVRKKTDFFFLISTFILKSYNIILFLTKEEHIIVHILLNNFSPKNISHFISNFKT